MVKYRSILSCLMGLFLILSSDLIFGTDHSKINSRCLKKIEKQNRASVIGFGHDTIGENKVPNLHFESRGCVNVDVALKKYCQIYGEVMRCLQRSSPSVLQRHHVLPEDQSGATIMVSFSPNPPGGISTFPFVSMVYNLHNGRVVVDSLNPKTDKFETVTETTLSRLFGFTDTCEKVSEKSVASEGGE